MLTLSKNDIITQKTSVTIQISMECAGRAYLVLSKENYNEILKKVTRKQDEEIELKKKSDMRETLRKQIEEMINDWPDSIARIEKRDFEKKEKRMKTFEDAMKESIESRKILMKQIEKDSRKKRKLMMMQKLPYLSLSKALYETYVIEENKALIELKTKSLEEEKRREENYAKIVIEDDRKFNENENRKKIETKEKNKKNQTVILKQIGEKEKNVMNEKNEGINQRIKELEIIKNEEMLEKIQKIEKIRLEREQMKEDKKIRFKLIEQRKNEDRELNEICSIYNETYEKRKLGVKLQHEKERADMLKIKDRIGGINRIDEKIKEDENNRRISNQIVEMEKKYQTEEKLKKEQINNKREEIIKFHLKHKEKVKEEQLKADKIRSFELAQRLKTSEVRRKYDEKKKIKEREKVLELKRQLEQKRKIDEENVKKSKEEKRKFDHFKDQTFFNYAAECLNHARIRNRNDYPIKREVKKYCKENGLQLSPECLQLKRKT